MHQLQADLQELTEFGVPASLVFNRRRISTAKLALYSSRPGVPVAKDRTARAALADEPGPGASRTVPPTSRRRD
jgi:hypothetical protein